MSRRKRGGKRYGAAAAAPTPMPSEPSALEKLRAATEHTDFLESRKKDRVPKPKAVRRYERYASMGRDE